MEISIKSVTLFFAVVLTGLSAGLFYAWMVSVIPGTRKLTDLTYMESMQSINREILNPAFFLIFFGSPISLAISTFQHVNTGLTFWLILAATAAPFLSPFLPSSLLSLPSPLLSLPSSLLSSLPLSFTSLPLSFPSLPLSFLTTAA
ncbi:MAG: hypothetical protein AAF655_24225 [Bacteroidota bacterium]